LSKEDPTSLARGMCPVCSTIRRQKEMCIRGEYFECGCGFAEKIKDGENNG